MKAVIQRVSEARVSVENQVVGSIGPGLLILLGVAAGDTSEEVHILAQRTAQLRIFENEQGKFDRSLLDVSGSALVVSQFTLLADTQKGRRPSFTGAAPPADAEALYDEFKEAMAQQGVPVAEGAFGKEMQVQLVNAGPVTIILDTDDSRRSQGSQT
jgi:D-tyrosyl-tRNA(Tyr) deacylase